MLSLQDLQGDNKVVNIIEDWDVLEEYAGEKLGFYQILAIEEHVKSEHNSERMVSRESLWRRFVDPFLNRILNFKSNCAQKKNNIEERKYLRLSSSFEKALGYISIG